MHPVLELATRRGVALARRDWDVVAAQLHPRFVYVDANGHRLDRDHYLAFRTAALCAGTPRRSRTSRSSATLR